MRKVLFALLGVAVGGMASAITCEWSWQSNGSTWQTSSAIYMVYSQAQLDADQVVSATNVSYGSATGAKNSTGGTWTSPTMPTSNTIVVSSPATKSETTGNWGGAGFSEGNFAWNDNMFGENGGYFYLVIFNSNAGNTATEFAVAQAGESGHLVKNGDGVAIPRPDEDPLPIDYIDPVWIGGTFRDAAPEPTALALLALGVAGAALRRRVR